MLAVGLQFTPQDIQVTEKLQRLARLLAQMKIPPHGGVEALSHYTKTAAQADPDIAADIPAISLDNRVTGQINFNHILGQGDTARRQLLVAQYALGDPDFSPSNTYLETSFDVGKVAPPTLPKPKVDASEASLSTMDRRVRNITQV